MAAPTTPAPEDDGRRPIGEVLGGLGIHPLLEGETPTFAFVLVRNVDVDGDVGWSYRTTSAPNREELLGALTIQVAILQRELMDDWPVDED